MGWRREGKRVFGSRVLGDLGDAIYGCSGTRDPSGGKIGKIRERNRPAASSRLMIGTVIAFYKRTTRVALFDAELHCCMVPVALMALSRTVNLATVRVAESHSHPFRHPSLENIVALQQHGLKADSKAFNTTKKYGEVVVAGGKWLVKLQRKHLTFGLEDSKAFNTPYFELQLTNQKGWQKRINKTQKEADLWTSWPWKAELEAECELGVN
ncbi:hypothetical protein B0H14DRAFT_2645884 [Mycena olivaceomarginata]|nr:hypothetical protein B0H14DRAFT_2645884 [Mycena olivaceomarginata]